MSQFKLVDIPDIGTLPVEVETKEEGLELTGLSEKIQEQLTSFEELLDKIKKTAKKTRGKMEDLSPDEVEFSCGITVGFEGKIPIWQIAKVAGEGNFTVTLKWNKPEGEQSK